MPNAGILYAAIAVSAAVTMLTRGAPYLLFGRKKELPPLVEYLGTALPPAIMIILVLYCLRHMNFAGFPFGLPEILSSALVVGVQLWKRNTILSIALGTACYMVLLRTVFAV